MTMRRSGVGLAAVLAMVACATVVRAEVPCVADVQKYCANVPTGGGRVQACLKDHTADLSANCKKHLDGLKKTIGALVAVCYYDIARFCGDQAPGGGRIAGCLQDHSDDLSPECKDRIKKNRKN
jgi:Cysteine rich repeat